MHYNLVSFLHSVTSEIQISQQNKLLLQLFHSGIYNNGAWTCCDQKDKGHKGCKKTFFAIQKIGKVRSSSIQFPSFYLFSETDFELF